MERLITVMAKHPRPGHAKTRLMPLLGADGAAELAACMVRDTVRLLSSRRDCDLAVAIDSEMSRSWFEREFPTTRLVLQRGSDLGARLDSVLTDGLDLGYSSSFAISSDSPDLPTEHISAAFTALDDPETDVVFGPADDGGFYLIGWKQPWSALVTEVEMSTPRVLTESLDLAARLDARVFLAPGWYDVDEPADLNRLREHVRAIDHPATAGFLEQVG